MNKDSSLPSMKVDGKYLYFEIRTDGEIHEMGRCDTAEEAYQTQNSFYRMSAQYAAGGGSRFSKMLKNAHALAQRAQDVMNEEKDQEKATVHEIQDNCKTPLEGMLQALRM